MVLKLKIFDVVFDNKIEGYEIEAFRGAVSKLAGYENNQFHNHISDNKLSYSYPLIQYKTINDNASLTFIGSAIGSAIKFFILSDRKNITISNRTFDLKIDTFSLRNAYFLIDDRTLFKYNLKIWQPLNQENYIVFKKLHTLNEKVNMLEKILIGNILSLAKSLNWIIDKQIKLQIDEITDEKHISFKRNKILVLDLIFTTNVQIPFNIGLGKGVSHGFGILSTSN